MTEKMFQEREVPWHMDKELLDIADWKLSRCVDCGEFEEDCECSVFESEDDY